MLTPKQQKAINGLRGNLIELVKQTQEIPKQLRQTAKGLITIGGSASGKLAAIQTIGLELQAAVADPSTEIFSHQRNIDALIARISKADAKEVASIASNFITALMQRYNADDNLASIEMFINRIEDYSNFLQSLSADEKTALNSKFAEHVGSGHDVYSKITPLFQSQMRTSTLILPSLTKNLAAVVAILPEETQAAMAPAIANFERLNEQEKQVSVRLNRSKDVVIERSDALGTGLSEFAKKLEATKIVPNHASSNASDWLNKRIKAIDNRINVDDYAELLDLQAQHRTLIDDALANGRPLAKGSVDYQASAEIFNKCDVLIDKHYQSLINKEKEYNHCREMYLALAKAAKRRQRLTTLKLVNEEELKKFDLLVNNLKAKVAKPGSYNIAEATIASHALELHTKKIKNKFSILGRLYYAMFAVVINPSAVTAIPTTLPNYDITALYQPLVEEPAKPSAPEVAAPIPITPSLKSENELTAVDIAPTHTATVLDEVKKARIHTHYDDTVSSRRSMKIRLGVSEATAAEASKVSHKASRKAYSAPAIRRRATKVKFTTHPETPDTDDLDADAKRKPLL